MIRKGWISFFGIVLLTAAVSRAADNPTKAPQAIHVREVAPPEGKAGDILTAFGDNLNATRVKELWLTDGKADFKLEILEQTDRTIRFRLPEWVPAGRLRIVVLSDADMMLEQPAFVKVREFRGPTTG